MDVMPRLSDMKNTFGHELGCVANRLGARPNVGLISSVAPSPEGLNK